MYKLEVNISDCPITGFKRKVSLDKFEWNLLGEFITLNTKVNFYTQENVLISKMGIHEYGVDLRADNTTMVNPANGLSVADGEPEESCTIGEYDMFIAAYTTNPIVLPALITGIIQQRDTIRHRFDI